MSETDTTFRMKQAAAGSAKKRFKELMNTKPFTLDVMREIMYTFFFREDVIMSWENLFNQVEVTGEPLLMEDIQQFKSDARAQFAQKLTYEVDPTSRVAMMGAQEEIGDVSWYVIRPDVLVANFKETGTYGCIYGVPRSGKTSFATKLSKIFAGQGMTVLTNIKMQNHPDKVVYVTTLSELIYYMITEDTWVCILDETGSYIEKKRAMAQRNIDFENLARFIGKLGGRLIMATHNYERDIPTKLQDFITETYWKRSKKRVKVDLNKEGGHVKFHQTIGNIPDATDSNGNPIYITEDISGLKFDVDLDKLLSEIPDQRGERQNEFVLEWLKEQEKERDRPSPEKIGGMVAKYAFDNNCSVKKAAQFIANKVGLAASTVRDYYYKERK